MSYEHPDIPILSMRITNPQAIVGGTYPHHNFDHQGGTIGSRGTNWLLHDLSGKIAPLHAQILMIENQYCLTDFSGNTFINGSQRGIGKNKIVRLSDGDRIRISNYMIAVSISKEAVDNFNHGDALHGLEMGEIIDPLAVHDNSDILIKETDYRDVIHTLNENPVKPDVLDPLLVMDSKTEDLTVEGDLIPADKDILMTSSQTPIDYTATTREAFVLPAIKPTTGVTDMSPDEPDLLKPSQLDSDESNWLTEMSSGQTESKATSAQGALPNHIAAMPLLKGMGVTMGELDSNKAHDFLREAGETIKATIEGIMKIYQSTHQVGDSTTLSLLSRNLHPIEDNPLRLKQDYKHTVQTMFSDERSYVHLTPPRAVEESLNQLADHQQAMLEAIQASLRELLAAFSPELLSQRFSRYASKPKKDDKMGGDWSWQMYTHYYRELTSSRQQGFEKLFWEVFEQTYDTAMRKKTE